MHDTAEYAASIPSSRRPPARGSSPAPSPIHAAPSIWNGSHGPTPPGHQRRGEHADRAEAEAEARPERAAAEHHDDPHRLEARMAAAEGTQRGGGRGEHAEQGDALRVHPAVGDLGEDDGEHAAGAARRTATARRPRARRASESVPASSGQPNAMTPSALVSSRATVVRGPIGPRRDRAAVPRGRGDAVAAGRGRRRRS